LCHSVFIKKSEEVLLRSPTNSPRSPLRIPLSDAIASAYNSLGDKCPINAIVDEQQTLVLSDCDSPLHLRIPIINGRTNTIYIPNGPLISSKNNLTLDSPKTSKSSKFSEITPREDWGDFMNISPQAANERLHIRRLSRAQGGSEFLKRALLNNTKNFDEGEFSPSQSGGLGVSGVSPTGGDGYETSDSDANYVNSCGGSPANATTPRDPTSISSPIASAYRQDFDSFSLRVREISSTRVSDLALKNLIQPKQVSAGIPTEESKESY
jgi:hypothetical protein